jgi:ABC-type glycerol-3-phosphate transport system permease component
MLVQIVAPVIAPIFAAAALWTFITSWSEATLPNLLLVNSTVETAPMALKQFAGISDTQVNLVSAGALLLVAPVVVALLVTLPAGRFVKSQVRLLVR